MLCQMGIIIRLSDNWINQGLSKTVLIGGEITKKEIVKL